MHINEQRLTPRFKTTDTCAVLIAQNHVVSHNLLDVGKGGLAFSYSKSGDDDDWVGEKRDIDLFGEGFFIANMPVRIVSDEIFNYPDVDEPSHTGKLLLRRCGVQFATLNSKQKNLIDSYVEWIMTLSS